jgi:MFS family permease
MAEIAPATLHLPAAGQWLDMVAESDGDHYDSRGGIPSHHRHSAFRASSVQVPLVMPSLALPRSDSPRLALILLFIMRGFILGNWIARIPAIAEHLGVSRAELGTVLIAGAIGALISFQTSAPRISSIGSARAILLFGIAWMLAYPMTLFAPGAIGFFIVLMWFGFCNGTTDVALNSQAVEIERRIDRPILSTMHGMFSVGALLGTATGGLLAALAVPIEAQFLVIAVAQSVFWWVLNPKLIADEPSAKAAPGLKKRRPIFSIGPRILWPLGAIAFCCGLVEEALADWGALYLTQDLFTNPGLAAMGFTIFSLTMLVGRLTGDQVVKRVGPVLVLRVGTAIGVLGLLGGVLINTPWSFLASFAFVGLGFSTIIPIAYRAAGSTPGVERAEGVAAVATACYAAFLIGPPVMGFIADIASLRLAFALVGGIVTMVIVLAPAVSRPSRQDEVLEVAAAPAASRISG